MATTTRDDPPKKAHHYDDDKAKAASKEPLTGPSGKEPEAKAHEAPKAAAPKQQEYPTLENAWSLFSNGHRIAKQGDDKYKWISQSRAADGVTIVTSPMTPEIEQAVKTGQYYLVEDQESYTHTPLPGAPGGGTGGETAAPKNVDVPYVSANGQQANCTMGNWKGEPTSYAYAWQRDGEPISGPMGRLHHGFRR